MSFVESILIPKSSFLDIKEKLNNKNKKNNNNVVVNTSTPKKTRKKKKKTTTTNDDNKINEDVKNRLEFAKRIYKKQTRQQKNFGQKPTHVGYKPEYDILRFFPKDESYVVFRIMKIIWENKSIINYDMDTYELTIKGKFYPNSSLVDILSYLIGIQQDKYLTSRHLWASNEKNIIIPEASYEFVQALTEVLHLENIKQLTQYFPGLDKQNVHSIIVNKDNIQDDDAFLHLIGKPRSIQSIKRYHPHTKEDEEMYIKDLFETPKPSTSKASTSKSYSFSTLKKIRDQAKKKLFTDDYDEELDDQEEEDELRKDEEDDDDLEEADEEEREAEEEEKRWGDDDDDDDGGGGFKSARASPTVLEQINDEYQRTKRKRKKPDRYTPSKYKK